MSKSKTLLAAVHPGEVLREDFMKPLSLTVTASEELHGDHHRRVCNCFGTAHGKR